MATTVLKYLVLEHLPLLISVYGVALKEVSRRTPHLLLQGTIVSEILTATLDDLKKSTFDLLIVNFDFPFSGSYVALDFLIFERKQNAQTQLMVTMQNATVHKLRTLLKKANPNCIVEVIDCTVQTLDKAISHLMGKELYYSPTILNLFQLMIKAEDLLDDMDYAVLHELSQGALIKELPAKVFLSPTSIYKRRQKLKEFFNTTEKADSVLIQRARELHYI